MSAVVDAMLPKMLTPQAPAARVAEARQIMMASSPAGVTAADDSWILSSTMVFHWLQFGHRPSHFGESKPHSRHTKIVFAFATRDSFHRPSGHRTLMPVLEDKEKHSLQYECFSPFPAEFPAGYCLRVNTSS